MDSNRNTYCLEKESVEYWLLKHPLLNEVDDEGCFKSDQNKCYIFGIEDDLELIMEVMKYDACKHFDANGN